MSWLVGVSLKFRLLVVAMAGGLLLVGMSQLPHVPIDILPEFAPPFVEIQTEALGLSAEEVEQMVTVPLEQDLLNGVAWLADIRSESVPGLSSIILTFEPGTDVMRGRQMVGERLTQAFALPHVSKPPTMLQPLSSSSRAMMIGLSSKDLSLIDVSVLARWTIAPRLMGVPGVANVNIWGQRDRQLQVQVDPRHLQEMGVSLQQVLETTGNAMWVSSLSFVEASTPGTGGFIETPNQRLGILHVFPISSPQGLAEVPVDDTARRPLRLGDVARVVEDHQPLIGDAVTNGNPGLMLVVEKLPGASTLDVTRGIETVLAAMRPGLPGLEMDSSIYRPATYIEMAMSNLSRSLLFGSVLLALVLALFRFEWRTTLISLVSIPLSLTAGALVLQLSGTSLNAMALAGFVIAVGVVIDDAITGVDNVVRRLGERRADARPLSTAQIVLDALVEVRSPMVYATLILTLAVLPAFFIGGVSGAFFLPMLLWYGISVLATMIVGLTVTPALCLLLLDNARVPRRQSPLVGWLQQRYSRLLGPALRTPRLALLATPALLVVGVAMLPFFRLSLLPAFKEPELLVDLDGAPGTSNTEMDRIVARASTELRTIAGVRNVGAHVGRAVMSDQVADVNSSELWVSLDPTADYDITRAAVQRVIDGYTGLHRSVQTYLQERSREVAPEVDSALTVRMYGDNLDVLRATADDVKHALAGVDGVASSRVQLPVYEPTVQIQVDVAAAQRYGLKPGDIRRAAATLLSGIQAGNLFEAQKVFDVVVWGSPETRASLSSIQDLLIDTPTGGRVRLRDVASVRVTQAPTAKRHESVRSYLDILASVHGRPLAAVAGDIEQRLQSVKFPLEYHAQVLGDYAARQATQDRLFGFTIVAVAGAFLLLQAAFGSWRLASAAFFTYGSFLVGGILASIVTGGVLTLGSLGGLLAVLGISLRSGMLSVRAYQHLEGNDGHSVGAELISRGAQERFTPIVLTALATGAVLVPFLLFGDIAGQEIEHPMAIVIVGGLVSATLLNLFVVPAMYLIFGTKAAQPEMGAPYLASQPLAVGRAPAD